MLGERTNSASWNARVRPSRDPSESGFSSDPMVVDDVLAVRTGQQMAHSQQHRNTYPVMVHPQGAHSSCGGGQQRSSAPSGLASRRRRYVAGDDESAAAECVRRARGKGVRAARTTHCEQCRHRREGKWPGLLDLSRLETASRRS